MQAWINGICDLVDERTARLPDYQDLLAHWQELLPHYMNLLDTLPEVDAEILREYEYLVKEMDYLKMQTAYDIGCSQSNRPD